MLVRRVLAVRKLITDFVLSQTKTGTPMGFPVIDAELWHKSSCGVRAQVGIVASIGTLIDPVAQEVLS